VILAGMFHMTQREYFEVDEAAEREPVRVSFDNPPTATSPASTPPAEPPAADPPAAPPTTPSQ
jgi:hypothetical protein